MVKPIKSKKNKEEKNEEMNTEEINTEEVTTGKVELDLNQVKKDKQFNPYAAGEKKETKKVKLTPRKQLKRKKGIENALNRIEKDQVFLEKKQKKMQIKKKWNSLY
ncbi:hypothetical protein DICPUDRAFT_78051 [Dictyostelium purpureum]|uniref:Uncharacterized protein n=1 Tax=Dictyostelium purpureum TaxID=5786 RepID=F0ZIE7_DICPU|nr:uncharacterized protein DICPUDRAFT_78051 [Dictyostelium purpureum]EGC36271.1 hypothetical protein DICPUDRAFT_78051 [Dictyostelium purpureum]|eukprot:XP_003287217.1 hypothetical protein DICPUDRAFT_78051 [Dictyostelium purpureum]